jgi:probable O-glycosylation ligase (exosortase A-associated)
MGLRDLALALLLIGGLPVAFRRPFVGALIFAGLGMLAPQSYMWGFAREFPWSKLYAVVIFLGVLASSEGEWKDSIRRYWLILLILGWAALTTVFALEPERALTKYIDVLKIQLMCLVTLALLNSRERIVALVAVIALSVAFYGTKGGFFTIIHGGEFKVWGPMESAIRDNNHLATGLVMLIPLLYWLSTIPRRWWMRLAILGSMVLCAVSVFGSHSRGAFLAVGAMSLFFLVKSDRKLLAVPLIVAGMVASVFVMPEKYWERIESIQSYQEDASAMGRINTWTTAIRIANDRITGGGYEYYGLRSFARYAPNPEAVHSAHSIYFQALGEHGWIGLLLFLAFWLTVWWQCGTTRRKLPPGPEHDSMRLLLRMIQVSLVGYAVGGAFVNIGNWDFPYYLAIVVFAANRLGALADAGTQAAPAPRGSRRQAMSFGNVRM